jgi:hypothetical protein
MRAFEPGGRFTVDFELNEIGDGITYDATTPFGTTAEWWIYDQAASTIDPVYDVEMAIGGRTWVGPHELSVISADLIQGNVPTSERGFYSADMLNLTVNVDDLQDVSPELFDERGHFKAKISDVNRYRAIWQSQVYRPYHVQPEGYLNDRGTLFTIRMLQVMPDELINDEQFQAYANGYEQDPHPPVNPD